MEDECLLGDVSEQRLSGRLERARKFEEQVDLEKLAYLFSSRRRLHILLAIDERWLTQKFISKYAGISLSNLGPLLKGLVNEGLVDCKSPKLRKNKVFITSQNGHRILEYVQEIYNAVKNGRKVTITEYELYRGFEGFLKRKRMEKNLHPMR